MTLGPNYCLIPGDWESLQYIINDLSRIITETPQFANYLLQDGSRALTANWDVGTFQITANNFVSDVAITTQPYACTSEVLNTHLNADLLDGQHGVYYQAAGNYQPLATNLTSLSGLTFASTSFVKMTSAGTFGLDTSIYYKSADSPTFANITDSGLTINRIPYASTAGLLIDSSDLTFDGTTLTATGFKVNTAYGTISAGTNIPFTNIIANFGKTFSTAVTYGIYGGAINAYIGTGAQNASTAYGLDFAATYTPGSPTGTVKITSIYGARAAARIISNDGETQNISADALYGFRSLLSAQTGEESSGNVNVVNAYHFYAPNTVRATGTDAPTPTYTNTYAYYDAGQTAGGTVNWGFYSVSGNNAFGGSLSIGKVTAPTANTLNLAATYNIEKDTNDLTVTTAANKTLLLSQVVWNDINVSMVTAKVPASNFPTWAAFTTNLYSYTFALNDYADMPTAEILHDYKEGTDLGFHLHIVTNGLNDATARKVKYIIYYNWGDMNEVMGGELNTTAELNIPAATADKTHLLLDFPDITGTTYKIGSLLKARVKRIAGTGTEPATDPFVEQMGIHYQIDTIGSRQELVK